ncbi:MAG: signal peptidase I [bacterium]|nr:signal peptidase I [bacterium]
MKKIIKDTYEYVIIIIIVVLIRTFIVSPVRVVGPSMKDTLLNGDIMLLDKISYKFNDIKRYDIVVIKYEGESIIKRVIGIPGDKVECINNKLYINDEKIDEKYLATGTITSDFSVESISGKETIPDGYYLVLGDNRENSKDSRMIGLIKKSNIKGKASYTLFPFSRFGKKK